MSCTEADEQGLTERGEEIFGEESVETETQAEFPEPEEMPNAQAGREIGQNAGAWIRPGPENPNDAEGGARGPIEPAPAEASGTVGDPADLEPAPEAPDAPQPATEDVSPQAPEAGDTPAESSQSPAQQAAPETEYNIPPPVDPAQPEAEDPEENTEP